MKGFDRIFLDDFCFGEALVIVEINEVGSLVVLTSLSAFQAVPGEMSYFSALEAGVRGVSCGGCVGLEVVLWAISLVSVRVLPSTEVIPSIVSSIVPSGWRPVSVYVHRDRSVVHPLRGVG